MPRKKNEPAPPGERKNPAVRLSLSLRQARPSANSLAKHAYQRKLAAHFAPHLLPPLFQAIVDGCKEGNVNMVRLGSEIYELIQSEKKVSILNLTDNRSVSIDARSGAGAEGLGGGGGSQRRSFESVARMLDETRQKRLTEGNPLAARVIDAEFSETPEGVSK